MDTQSAFNQNSSFRRTLPQPRTHATLTVGGAQSSRAYASSPERR
jgi:hypothetical protein